MLGTTTSRDRAILAIPRFCVLTHTPPTAQNLMWIEVHKRVTPGDPTQDVLVHRERVVDRIPGVYPYFVILIHSEANAAYVIDYLNTNYAGLAARIATEQYAPPAGIDREIYVNGAMAARELVRRDYTVLETMGERAILLRRRTSGVICDCRQDESRQAHSNCRRCYGTGWQGGFTVFHPFLFNWQPAGERLQLTETAIMVDQQPRAWTTIVPEMRDGDFIVRLHAQLQDRFEITNPTRSVRDGVAAIPTIQEFSVRVHQQGHPIMNFPVEGHVPSYQRPTSESGLPEAGI
jgi:hypothetical protein